MSLDAVAEAVIARIEAIRRAVVADARAVLAKMPETDRGKVDVSEPSKLAVLAQIRRECVRLLVEHGKPEVVATADKGVVAAMEDAAEAPVETGATKIGLKSTGHGASFAGESLGAIRAVVSGALDIVSEAFKVGGEEVRAAVDVGATTPISLDTFVAKVAERMEVCFSRAETAVETAIRAAWRATTIAQTERGASAFDEVALFLYDGPDDGKIREFCEEHVGRVYTTARLNQDDNEQGLEPTSIYLGGYNCRHRLSPITREDAEAEGYEIIE